jgi:hypothetical protein
MTINLYLRPYIPLTYPHNISLAGYSPYRRDGTLSAKQQKDTREGNAKTEVSENVLGNNIL